MFFYLSSRLKGIKLTSRTTPFFLKTILILLIFFFENSCCAQHSTDIYRKVISSSIYYKGLMCSRSIENSFYAAKIDCEYYFSKNKSIIFDIFYGKVNDSNIPDTFFEKGLSLVKFSYFINSFIVREIDQDTNFSTAFGGECVYFKSTKGYQLKGHSVLIRPTIVIDSNQFIPFLNYNFSIVNSLSMGIFRGELKPMNNQNTYNCSFYRLSIESGFHFPIYKNIRASLLYQSDLFGEEISYHGYNFGILCTF